MRKFFFAALAAACFVLPAGAFAHSFDVGALHIGHPWSLAMPAGAPAAAGYFSVTNNGKTADTLIGVETDQAESVSIHQTRMQNGMMRMDAVKQVAIAPGATVTFAPGGYHLMLVKPKGPLGVGSHIYVTLRFAHAGAVKADFHVQASPPSGKGEGGGSCSTCRCTRRAAAARP
jgi:copper(I)-binding protein